MLDNTELSINLISVGRLENWICKIGNGILKMKKGTLVSIKGIRKNDIYVTTGEVIRAFKIINLFCQHCSNT